MKWIALQAIIVFYIKYEIYINISPFYCETFFERQELDIKYKKGLLDNLKEIAVIEWKRSETYLNLRDPTLELCNEEPFR